MAKYRFKASRLLMRLRKIIGNDQLVLSALAVLVGAGTGGGVILFRETIGFFQKLAFGSDDELLYIQLINLAWWQIMLPPVIGGLVIGLFVHYLMPGRRPRGVADVMESMALRSGRMSPKAGVGAALIIA